jgi:hypothetical protein
LTTTVHGVAISVSARAGITKRWPCYETAYSKWCRVSLVRVLTCVWNRATGALTRGGVPRPTFSASPIAADGKIYLANEDGEMLVVSAGREFRHIATNAMGELLMATPALSRGVMYVRGLHTLFAIGATR